MPRSNTKSDEIDEIVDDLEGLEDEDLASVEDDPDEAPKKSRTRKAKAPKEKKEKVGIGTTEVAELIGTTPRELRVFLRSSKYQPKDDREGRYNWSGPNDPEVKRIVKEFRANAAKADNKEATKAAKGKKAKAEVVEDDE
jgi:phage antirepressor YoqD-like protein